MDYLDKARRVIDLEISELRRLRERLDGPALERAVGLLLRCLENRGKIVVVGVGKSGHVGEKIAATLTSTGSTAVVLNSLNALHGDLGVVSDGDAVLALSASGETDELVNLLPALLRFDISLIALTGRAARRSCSPSATRWRWCCSRPGGSTGMTSRSSTPAGSSGAVCC